MLGVLIDVIETGDLAALLRASEEMNDAKNKDRFEENLDILQSLIHDVWTLAVSGDRGRVTNPDLCDRLETLAQNASIQAQGQSPLKVQKVKYSKEIDFLLKSLS